MIIRSIAFRTPSRRITNDDILGLIRDENRDIAASRVSQYCETIKRLLEKNGAETRYLRDKARGERGFDLLMDAVRAAINDASIGVPDIDLIIYCGVGRGFVEPANAVFVAKALGASCDAFDLNEACMSWVRSLQLAHKFFATQQCSSVLVVNAEFTTFENGLPGILRVRSDDSLGYTFPALTIGEAVTATILTPSDRPWMFRFRNLPALAPLCNLPAQGYEDFCDPDERLGLNGPHQLVAFGTKLSRASIREMVAFVRATYQNIDQINLWLPHSPSEAMLRLVADRLGLGQRLYAGIFRQYGNLVSASIPAAIVAANKGGFLKSGDRFVLCPVSAGMAFGLVEGTY